MNNIEKIKAKMREIYVSPGIFDDRELRAYLVDKEVTEEELECINEFTSVNKTGNPFVLSLVKLDNGNILITGVTANSIIKPTPDEDKTIGIRLRKLRDEMGISQRQLAEEVEVNAMSIVNYESGKRTPDAKLIVKLARYFNCTTDYLLGLTDFENEKITKDFLESQKTLWAHIDSLDGDLQKYFVGMLNSFFIAYADYKFSIKPDIPANKDIIVHLANMVRHYTGMIWQSSEFVNRIKEGCDREGNSEVDRAYALVKINTEKLHLEHTIDKMYQLLILSAIDDVVDEDVFKEFKKLFSAVRNPLKDGD